ncbi:MAG: hypothetical protein JST73_06410 [Actinobacteria bacterium]|nr:hypothetical protein [Actinomycetota bacterium]
MNARSTLDAGTVEKFLTVSDPWLSCEGCFEHIDVAVESLLATGSTIDEPLRVHLVSCAVCHEEAQRLAELVGIDLGLGESESRRRLEDAL